MVTILDIAREAGVSHGTVSNVLNWKGNVSLEKIKRVEAAALKLGYQMNHRAKSLRAGESNLIGVIIPTYDHEEYIDLYIGLERKFRKEGYQTQVHVTLGDPDIEKEVVSLLSQEKVTAVVAVSCLDDADYYYKTIGIDKEKVVFINRKPRNAYHYISFDYQKAGYEIGAAVKEKAFRKIGVFLTDEENLNQKNFIQALNKQLSQCEVTVFAAQIQDANKMAYKIAQDNEFDCLITTSKEKVKLLQKAYYFGTFQKAPHVYVLSSASGYEQNVTVYHLNYFSMGIDLAQKFINGLEKKEPGPVVSLYENDGFEKTSLKKFPNTSLRLLTLHSPSSEALMKILPLFQKMTNIEVQVEMRSFEDISAVFQSGRYRDYDLIRTDMAIFPWVAEEVFQPLDGLHPEVDQIFAELPQTILINYVQANQRNYMVPFDPSVQMMFYRKDLFENQMIKRMFYEKKKVHLKPPATYEQLVEVATFFHENPKEYVGVDFALSMNQSNPVIIAAEFLTVYFALGGKLLFDDNQVRLASEPGLKAIELYQQLFQIAKKEEAFWWEASVQSFVQGETAMTIGFVNHLSVISHSRLNRVVGYQNVPGAHPLLGGGVLGLVKQSKEVEAAIQFILWLHQRSVSEEITKLGGVPSNQQVNDEKDIHYHFPWLRHVNDLMESGLRQTKTANGNPVNTHAIETAIGSALKKHFGHLQNSRLVLEEINNALLRSKKMPLLKQ